VALLPRLIEESDNGEIDQSTEGLGGFVRWIDWAERPVMQQISGRLSKRKWPVMRSRDFAESGQAG
jgi:hypothetical protein